MSANVRYIITSKFGIVELWHSIDNLWRDSHGTVYAIRDQSSLDGRDRCGIFPAVMPFNTPMEDACKPHDYMHDSTAYQMFHSMHEANLEFRRLSELATKKSFWRILKEPFYLLTEVSKPFLPWAGKK